MTIETKFNIGDTVYVDRPFSQWWPSLTKIITIGEIRVSTHPKLLVEYRERNGSTKGTWFAQGWCRLKSYPCHCAVENYNDLSPDRTCPVCGGVQ